MSTGFLIRSKNSASHLQLSSGLEYLPQTPLLVALHCTAPSRREMSWPTTRCHHPGLPVPPHLPIPYPGVHRSRLWKPALPLPASAGLGPSRSSKEQYTAETFPLSFLQRKLKTTVKLPSACPGPALLPNLLSAWRCLQPLPPLPGSSNGIQVFVSSALTHFSSRSQPWTTHSLRSSQLGG